MARNSPVDALTVFERILREGADAPLTRGEAAALVATRIKGPSETDRAVRNRIAMQMDRSLAQGDDYMTGGLARLPDGRFTADEIARWAMLHHGNEAFADLPIKSRSVKETLVDKLEFTGRISTETLPGSIPASHAEIMRLRAELRMFLEQESKNHRDRALELAARFKKK